MAAVLKTSGKWLLKIGIGATVIVFTAKEGVWSTDNRHGFNAVDKVRTRVLVDANNYVEKIPAPGEVSSNFKTSWNSGVQSVFQSLANVPENTKKLISDTVSGMNK